MTESFNVSLAASCRRPVTVESVAPSSTALFTGQRDSVESGLGAGAIAGIVVGAIALVLIWVAYMFLRRRQQRRHGAGTGAYRLDDSTAGSDDGKDAGGAVGDGGDLKGKGRAGAGGDTSIQMSAMPSVPAARQPPPTSGMTNTLMGQMRGAGRQPPAQNRLPL